MTNFARFQPVFAAPARPVDGGGTAYAQASATPARTTAVAPAPEQPTPMRAAAPRAEAPPAAARPQPTPEQRSTARAQATQHEGAVRQRLDPGVSRAELERLRQALPPGLPIQAHLRHDAHLLAQGRPLTAAEAQQVRDDVALARRMERDTHRGAPGAVEPRPIVPSPFGEVGRPR